MSGGMRLSRLSIESGLLVHWEREKCFHCNSILFLEILRNHSCNSPSLATLVCEVSLCVRVLSLNLCTENSSTRNS